MSAWEKGAAKGHRWWAMPKRDETTVNNRERHGRFGNCWMPRLCCGRRHIFGIRRRSRIIPNGSSKVHNDSMDTYCCGGVRSYVLDAPHCRIMFINWRFSSSHAQCTETRLRAFCIRSKPLTGSLSFVAIDFVDAPGQTYDYDPFDRQKFANKMEEWRIDVSCSWAISIEYWFCGRKSNA